MRTPAWCRRQAAASARLRAGHRDLLADNALYRLRAAQGVIGLADKHDRAGSKPPARRRSPPETRPTGQSRASWPPEPNGRQPPAAAGDGGAAAFLRGPASFANVIPMPGTLTSDAVHPASAAEHT